MPRILLLAATTGYQTRSFAEAAQRLRVEVTLATDRCHILENPWGDNAIPTRFDEPAAVDCEGIDGIVAVADRPTVTAALTAAKLGLLWHPAAAARACRNKHTMRELFAAAGLPVPAYCLVSSPQPPDTIGFPCVLKPLGLSASRGVIRANNLGEFEGAFARIRRLTADPIQVESYIPGREFALEGLMHRGTLQTLAIFDKPDPLEGPFFEETIYVTPSGESGAMQRRMMETTDRAARALGLFHGPIHAEMRVNESGVFMLEIAARPIGGLCARALRFLTPAGAALSLEEVVILHAVGAMPPELAPASRASGVMMIPVPRAGIFESVEGVEEAGNVPGIEDIVITAKQGERLVPLPEGAGYTGFIFARAATPEDAAGALRTAHAALRFHVQAALPVWGQKTPAKLGTE